jgi:tetratricopeptide (TPR) repeat protein
VLRAQALLLDIVDAAERYEQAVDAYVAAADATGDVLALSDALRARAFRGVRRGNLAAARADAERSVALAQGGRDGRLLRLGLHAAAHVANLEGRYAEARRWTEDALASARNDGDLDAECTTLVGLATGAYERGAYEVALDRLADAERAAARLDGALRHEIRIAGTRGNALFGLGRFHEAEAAYAKTLVLAERLGDRDLAGITMDNRAGVLVALGRLGTALAAYDEAEALFDQLGGLAARRHNTRANRGALLLAIGDLPAARPLLEDSLAFFERSGIRRLALAAQTSLARLLAAEGEAERARREAEEVVAACRSLGWGGVADAALLATSLAFEAGDVAGARGHARLAEEAAAATHAAGDRHRAIAWRALLGDGPREVGPAPPMARFDEVELRLLRARRSGEDEERVGARLLLADLEASLPDVRQAAFRSRAPISRWASAWGA